MSVINRKGTATILVVIVLALLLPGEAQAQKVLSEGIKDLATQIATGVVKEQKHKVAVLPFRELDGNATVLGTYISEELVTNLFMIGGLDIVERSLLDKLLGEMRLGETGVIDQETATKVGKIAGVDAIVTGTITDLQSYVALNCRLIDTRTGRIFGAAQAKIVKDDDVRKIMGAPLPASSGGTQGRQPSGPAKISQGKQDTAKADQQQQTNGFLFELKKCTLSGRSVECDFFITNNKNDREIEIFSRAAGWQGGGSTRLIDTDGIEHVADGIFLGSTSRGSGQSMAKAQLASGIPIRAKITFEGVSAETELAGLVEIRCYSDSNFSVQFRKVPLVKP